MSKKGMTPVSFYHVVESFDFFIIIYYLSGY